MDTTMSDSVVRLECSLVLALGFAAAPVLALEPAAAPAANWDRMFTVWIAVAVGIYLIVALPMLYFLWRYRYRAGVNETGATEEAGPGIEVLWTVVPLIIVLFLATQSAALYAYQRSAPPDALPVKANARMWAWEFEYPNGKQSTGELYVPVGKPVRLLLTSQDVIHSLHIPAAKVMEDAVRGRTTELWFEFKRPGEYRAFCREYCGTMHAYMLASVKAVGPDEFDRWLAQKD